MKIGLKLFREKNFFSSSYVFLFDNIHLSLKSTLETNGWRLFNPGCLFRNQFLVYILHHIVNVFCWWFVETFALCWKLRIFNLMKFTNVLCAHKSRKQLYNHPYSKVIRMFIHVSLSLVSILQFSNMEFNLLKMEIACISFVNVRWQRQRQWWQCQRAHVH